MNEEVLLEALTLAAVESAAGEATTDVRDTVDRWMDRAVRIVAARRLNMGALSRCVLPQ